MKVNIKHQQLSSLILIGVSLLFITSAMAKEAVRGFDKSGEAIKDQHLIPHMSNLENYAEKYTFDADFGEKGRFYFSMQISNIGAGDHKMKANGALTLNGEKTRWSFKKDSGAWKYYKKQLYIKAGNATLSGSVNALRFHVKSKDVEFSFVFTPIAKPWRPSNGGLIFGKKKRTEYNLFPLSNVEGQVIRKNKPLTQLKGVGWGTHTWSHLGPHEQNLWTTQFRGVGFGDQHTLYFREMYTGGDFQKKRLSYVILTKGKELLFEGFNYTQAVTKTFVDKKHTNKYKIPEEFTINAKSIVDPKSTLSAKFSPIKRTHWRNPIAKYSWIKRKIIERFSKPMEYAYIMKYEATIKGAKGELTVRGDKGKYEIYHFNK